MVFPVPAGKVAPAIAYWSPTAVISSLVRSVLQLLYLPAVKRVRFLTLANWLILQCFLALAYYKLAAFLAGCGKDG